MVGRLLREKLSQLLEQRGKCRFRVWQRQNKPVHIEAAARSGTDDSYTHQVVGHQSESPVRPQSLATHTVVEIRLTLPFSLALEATNLRFRLHRGVARSM